MINLKREKERLKELETKGIEAISEYDLHICYDGDEKTALNGQRGLDKWFSNKRCKNEEGSLC